MTVYDLDLPEVCESCHEYVEYFTKGTLCNACRKEKLKSELKQLQADVSSAKFTFDRCNKRIKEIETELKWI